VTDDEALDEAINSRVRNAPDINSWLRELRDRRTADKPGRCGQQLTEGEEGRCILNRAHDGACMLERR
jgi:hypothetical protein